jgi:hypothetical protein
VEELAYLQLGTLAATRRTMVSHADNVAKHGEV